MDTNDVQADLQPETEYKEKFRCTTEGSKSGYIFFQMLNTRNPEGYLSHVHLQWYLMW